MRPEKLLAWSPCGPGRATCRTCGQTVSTNALAQASHVRGKYHEEACKRKEAEEATRASRRTTT